MEIGIQNVARRSTGGFLINGLSSNKETSVLKIKNGCFCRIIVYLDALKSYAFENKVCHSVFFAYVVMANGLVFKVGKRSGYFKACACG